MKRIFPIASVLLILCITLCACGKVQNAEKLIDAIGDVTADSGPQIEAAEQAIAELDADQKAKVSNLDLFEDAKLQYADALEVKKENDKKINRVEERIQAIKTVTTNSGNTIRTAREAFDRLDPELQANVSNKDSLFEAETAFEQLAIQTVTDAIDQIGTVTLENEKAISTALATYNKFDKSIQQKIENRDILFAAEETLTQLKVERAQAAIEVIGDVTLDSKAAIDSASAAFDSIPTADRAKVENRAELTKAKETYDALVHAQEVQKEIEEAKKLIRVTKVAVSSPDSVGGVKLYFNFVNNSDKTIKYLHFGVTFYNAVNDVVLPDYDKQAINYCQETGPYKKGEGLSGTNWYWGKFYSFDIQTVKLVYLKIDYADGATVTLTKDQVDGAQY